MSTDAFNKIKAGLEEAIAFSKGEDTGAVVHEPEIKPLELKVGTVYLNKRNGKRLIKDCFTDQYGIPHYRDHLGYDYDKNGEAKSFSVVLDLAEELFECHGLDNQDSIFFYEHDYYVFSNFSSFQIDFPLNLLPTDIREQFSSFVPESLEQDRFSVLSNIPSNFYFSTSEHLYHWLRFALAKTIDALEVAVKIRRATSAHEAFELAQENKHLQVKNWDDIKFDWMEKILRLKVEQHGYVKQKLIASGDRELIEDSWRDPIWGIGPNKDGQNMLGKIWMKIRSDYL